MRILIAEDDSIIADGLCRSLRGSGYAVDRAANGMEADTALVSTAYDLLILDLGLPKLSGLEVLKRLRSRGSALPVLILTAMDGTEDRVRGLDLGADDYMVKPFDVGEFEARVRSILRRQAGLHASDVQIGPVRFDMAARRFHVGEEHLDLPARELALLELFFLRAGRVVGKEAIVQSLTTLDDSLSDNAIEQYVSRLRRRIAPYGLAMKTARGLGYFIEPAVDEA